MPDDLQPETSREHLLVIQMELRTLGEKLAQLEQARSDTARDMAAKLDNVVGAGDMLNARLEEQDKADREMREFVQAQFDRQSAQAEQFYADMRGDGKDNVADLKDKRDEAFDTMKNGFMALWEGLLKWVIIVGFGILGTMQVINMAKGEDIVQNQIGQSQDVTLEQYRQEVERLRLKAEMERLSRREAAPEDWADDDDLR